MLKIGVPKEIKPFERRVGLTPDAAGTLVSNGFVVYCQNGAGMASGFSDSQYRRQGVILLPSARAVYREAAFIKKVKEPQKSEIPYLEKRHTLFSFLHLASKESFDLVSALVKSRCTAIGYETIRLKGRHPILAPMSQIAGALGACYGSLFRKFDWEGKRVVKFPSKWFAGMDSIAELYPKVPKNLNMGNVVIWGAGAAGGEAIRVAIQLAKKLTVVEKDAARLKVLKRRLNRTGLETHVTTPRDLKDQWLLESDILIGCAHATGRRAAEVLKFSELKRVSCEKKKVIVDIAVDQGGNFPGTRSTTYKNPAYVDAAGNLRFAVANIPSLSGSVASVALSKTSVKYTRALVQNFKQALKKYPELRGAVNVKSGKVVLKAVREVHKL